MGVTIEMKKLGYTILVLLCTAMVVSGCAASKKDTTKEKKEPVQEKEYQGKLNLIQPSAYNNVEGLTLEPGSYISIIGKEESGAYWNEVKAGAEQAVADINEMMGYEGKEKVKVTYSGPSKKNSVDEQVNILDEELARYPVALGIAIVDTKACEVQFDLAAESGIPIVAFDSGSEYQGLMSTISTDNAAAARDAAGKFAELIGDAGEVAVFVQDSKSESANVRETAFLDEIKQNHPDISIVEIYHMDQSDTMKRQIAAEINAGIYQKPEDVKNEADQPVAAPIITEADITDEDIVDYILTKHPNLKGCFATSEDAVGIALDGIERVGNKDLTLVGFDMNEELKKALEEGSVDGLIVQNPFGIGYGTVVASARAALEQGNEAIVDTGYTWVTKENLKEESVQKILY